MVAVDGHGGSGKSSLAEWLADALEAPVVHTDDFASWDNPIDWWPVLLEKVLRPLAEGQPARYVPNSWGGPPQPQVTIAPTDFVILEGVTATRAAFRPYLAFSIWVETPSDLRLRRGIERDGEAMRGQWLSWMKEEDQYVADERPQLTPTSSFLAIGISGSATRRPSLPSRVGQCSGASHRERAAKAARWIGPGEL